MLTADHTRIIDQLNAGHAAMEEAGLGSPALDDFHELTIEIVSESPDPWATVHAITDLLEREGHRHHLVKAIG